MEVATILGSYTEKDDFESISVPCVAKVKTPHIHSPLDVTTQVAQAQIQELEDGDYFVNDLDDELLTKLLRLPCTIG